MTKGLWEKHLLELIRRTSTDLPIDVETKLRQALRAEKKGSRAHWALNYILQNVEMSRRESLPICQDTGTIIFYFSVPVGFDTNMLASRARVAVSRATRMGYLRENTVDPVTGASYPTNIASGAPVFHFVQGARKTVDVRLVLKGGGCENVGTQYSLPDVSIEAGRDLAGVHKCILDAVYKAQGRGCAPGVLGVSIGGDRATGYAHSKEQFLRKVSDSSPVRALARIEKRVMLEAKKLDVGPMGFGGKSALLGVKIGSLSRIPASFFVTVSYMCWAFRRRGALLGPQGGVRRWLY